jgi:hypothetical protein
MQLTKPGWTVWDHINGKPGNFFSRKPYVAKPYVAKPYVAKPYEPGVGIMLLGFAVSFAMLVVAIYILKVIWMAV